MHRDDDEDDFEVGYGHPPKQHQFKPGESGNPKGRPKHSHNLKTLIQRELKRVVPVKEGSRIVQKTMGEVIVRQLVNGAAKGDDRKIKTVLAMQPEDEPEEFEPDASDLKTLQRALKNYRPDGKKG